MNADPAGETVDDPQQYPSPYLTDRALYLLDKEIPTVCVFVAQTNGSVPRDCGSIMLVSKERFWGSIGGGHLEWKSLAQARNLIDQYGAGFSPTINRYALGPSLGQCCGGTADIRFEPLTKKSLASLRIIDQPLFSLNLFGAGHVGKALIRVLRDVPCRIRWVDEREDIFPDDLPANTSPIWSADALAEVGHADPGDFYLVMTHPHDLDFDLIHQILQRGDSGYVGLIGSKTKRTRFFRRLAQRGVLTETIHCPIGVAGRLAASGAGRSGRSR